MTAIAETLTSRTTRAGQWNLANSLVGGVSQLAIGVLLARLLTPADFGVLALASVVLGLSRPIGQFGIGRALMQRAELTDGHVRVAFTFSVLQGLAITALMAAGAPMVALLMRELRVTPVLRVLSVGFAFRGAAVVADALLRRNLDFRRQFFIDSASYLLGYGGVAIVLAVLGHGVWSLVWGGVVQALMTSTAQLAAVRHSVRPLFARRELADLLRFGVGAHLSASANYVALTADNFVVGRWMGASSLGLYTRAYNLMNVPYTLVAGVISTVLFPALSQVQREPARVRRGYLLATELTSMVAGPSLATLLVAAPHVVPFVYGSQWTGVVVPLQILCVAGYFRALYTLSAVVAQSVGRVYSEMWRQMVYAGLVIGGSIAGSRYDLPGVSIGISVAILTMFVTTGQLALRATATPWRLYLLVQVGALVTAAITYSTALCVRLVLETYRASTAIIALGVLTAAAVPWSIGIVWELAQPDFEPLRNQLPRLFVQLVEAVPVRLRLRRSRSI